MLRRISFFRISVSPVVLAPRRHIAWFVANGLPSGGALMAIGTCGAIPSECAKASGCSYGHPNALYRQLRYVVMHRLQLVEAGATHACEVSLVGVTKHFSTYGSGLLRVATHTQLLVLAWEGER